MPTHNVKQGRRDWRLAGVIVTAIGTAAIGYLVTVLPGQRALLSPPPLPAKADAPGFDALSADTPGLQSREMAERATPGTPPGDTSKRGANPLGRAQELISAGKFDEAIDHLTRARDELPSRSQGLMLVGQALLGKKDYRTAYDFFNQAIKEAPELADAYFGLAVASEALGDLPGALGGMRAFLHLDPNRDPYRLKAAQARSAIWEWESRLGRGAWGPTKGVPPGFTEEELRRDGRGVAGKMPVPGSANEFGFSRYEIRHSDKTGIFNK